MLGSLQLSDSIYAPFYAAQKKVQALAKQFERLSGQETLENTDSIAQEKLNVYLQMKRQCTAYILDNLSSVSSYYFIYQRLNDDIWLFNSGKDAQMYKLLADSLTKHNSGSPYAKSIASNAIPFREPKQAKDATNDGHGTGSLARD
ncbi:MAG: hypothetical protein HC896_11010 [Bacteroidales bacterium]|nr:hypothetical protein [Bacteroidales bacterium]